MDGSPRVKTILLPGDVFLIRTRRMAAEGRVVKANRLNVRWASDYRPAPDGPIYHLEGTISNREFSRALVRRGETYFTLL